MVEIANSQSCCVGPLSVHAGWHVVGIGPPLRPRVAVEGCSREKYAQENPLRQRGRLYASFEPEPKMGISGYNPSYYVFRNPKAEHGTPQRRLKIRDGSVRGLHSCLRKPRPEAAVIRRSESSSDAFRAGSLRARLALGHGGGIT